MSDWIVTSLGHGIHVARRMVGRVYNFVVTIVEHDGGRVLKLYGAHGKLPPRDELKALRRDHFPGARSVAFERNEDAGLRSVKVKIKPTYWQRCVACLRAFYGFPR